MDTAKKQDLHVKQKSRTVQTIGSAKKKDLLSKKAEHYKTMDIAKKTRPVKQKSRTIQNNGYC